MLDEEWCIVEDKLDISGFGARETVCALGNGYLGVRGAPEEGHPSSGPATFIAGVFDAPPGGVPELVVVPNWLCMRVFIDDEECTMASGELLDFRRTLDMRCGVLERVVRWRGRRHGRPVRLTWRRIVSMEDIRLAAVSLSIEPEAGEVDVVVGSRIDGRVSNAKAVHLDLVEQGWDGDANYIVTRTRSSGIMITQAQIVAASVGTASAGGRAPTRRSGVTAEDTADGPMITVRLRCRCGERATIEKYVGFATSIDVPLPGDGRTGAAAGPDERGAQGHASCGGDTRAGDDGAGNALAAALSAARRGAACGFAGLLERHRRVWHDIWDRCDIVIEGDEFAQRAVRFAIFQMVQAAPRHTDRVSIGARGLSGEGYRGHVFWDTETFVVPFFTFTLPDVARNILGYRYHTLPAARKNAAAKGYRGAMFAWESADTGEEATPPWGDPNPETGERRRILCGDLEHHITADVAYAVWQYCAATADEEFFLRQGAEILIETGRFWASRASYNPALQAYEILHVIGPDEYHEDVNNNFYTNAMARWNIRAALATNEYLRARHPSEWARLVSSTGISEEELAHMADVATRLVCGRTVAAFDAGPAEAVQGASSGCAADSCTLPPPGVPVIEQFDGFHDLADVEIQTGEGTFRPMEAVIGPERLAGSKVVKQPDVLMALYLLGDGIVADFGLAVEPLAGECESTRDRETGSQGIVSPSWARLQRWGSRFWAKVARANWDYYEPRTDHGSSLSCAIHSTLASRLGLGEQSWRYFLRAVRIDLEDSMGNAVNGVHMATQGGVWQAVVNGFAGIHADVSVPHERGPHAHASGLALSPEDVTDLAPWACGSLRVEPRLPRHWRRLSVPFVWRGTKVRMELRGLANAGDARDRG